MTRPMSFVNVLSCCTSKLTNRFTELLPTHGPSSSRCNSLLWLHVLFAVSWGWRDRQPLYLPSHEIFWLLRGKGTCVRYCWIPGHCGFGGNETVDQLAKATIDQNIKTTGKCPLYTFEATGQLLHSAVCSIQVGCSCIWQISLPCETNTAAAKGIPTLLQSRRSYNHPTSRLPPYLTKSLHMWHTYTSLGGQYVTQFFRTKGQRSRSQVSFQVMALSARWFRPYLIE